MAFVSNSSGQPQGHARDAGKTVNATIMGIGRMRLTRLSTLQGHPFLKLTAVAGGKSLITQAVSPNVAAYETYFRGPQRYPFTAMSILASGAISPDEAVAYVRGLGIRSIVFGAFSRQHIQETMELIQGGFRA
jgi:hypothetical protein